MDAVHHLGVVKNNRKMKKEAIIIESKRCKYEDETGIWNFGPDKATEADVYFEKQKKTAKKPPLQRINRTDLMELLVKIKAREEENVQNKPKKKLEFTIMDRPMGYLSVTLPQGRRPDPTNSVRIEERKASMTIAKRYSSKNLEDRKRTLKVASSSMNCASCGRDTSNLQPRLLGFATQARTPLPVGGEERENHIRSTEETVNHSIDVAEEDLAFGEIIKDGWRLPHLISIEETRSLAAAKLSAVKKFITTIFKECQSHLSRPNFCLDYGHRPKAYHQDGGLFLTEPAGSRANRRNQELIRNARLYSDMVREDVVYMMECEKIMAVSYKKMRKARRMKAALKEYPLYKHVLINNLMRKMQDDIFGGYVERAREAAAF